MNRDWHWGHEECPEKSPSASCDRGARAPASSSSQLGAGFAVAPGVGYAEVSGAVFGVVEVPLAAGLDGQAAAYADGLSCFDEWRPACPLCFVLCPVAALDGGQCHGR